MTPLEYGTVEVKVMRDRHGNPCIVYPVRGRVGHDTQVVCTMLPDGSMPHEKLTARTAKSRFYTPSKDTPYRVPYTDAEAEYFLVKYCRHYRMERSAFNIVVQFGRRRVGAHNKPIAPNNGKRKTYGKRHKEEQSAG